VVAGLFGAIVLASPAQAHHPMLGGSVDCQADGQYKITWTVQNGNWQNPFMKLTKVVLTPNTSVTNIAVDAWLNPDQTITGEQFVPGNTTSAKLYVEALWYKHKTDRFPKVWNKGDKTLQLPGTCKAEPDPTVTFEDECDGTTSVHLVNPTETKKTFRIKGTDFDKTVELAKGETDESVPASAGAFTVSVKRGESWVEIGKHDAWARPEKCEPPTVFSWSSCDEFKIAVTNPEGNQAVTVKITYGSQTTPQGGVEVGPGKTGEFKFSPSSTKDAQVELSGWPTQTMTYDQDRTLCDTLPKTGSNTTTFIASGTGLAMLGGLAFFFARRRMVKLRKLASY
jgi:LPXTG-motif cell wall-anchored protein